MIQAQSDPERAEADATAARAEKECQGCRKLREEFRLLEELQVTMMDDILELKYGKRPNSTMGRREGNG